MKRSWRHWRSIIKRVGLYGLIGILLMVGQLAWPDRIVLWISLIFLSLSAIILISTRVRVFFSYPNRCASIPEDELELQFEELSEIWMRRGIDIKSHEAPVLLYEPSAHPIAIIPAEMSIENKQARSGFLIAYYDRYRYQWSGGCYPRWYVIGSFVAGSFDEVTAIARDYDAALRAGKMLEDPTSTGNDIVNIK